MAIRGIQIVTNGLIGLWDKYDEKSYLDQPTTNVVTNTNLNTGWSQGYNTDIVWDDHDPPVGVDSPVVSFRDVAQGGSGYWYSYGDYAPQGDGVQYTISLYIRTNQESPFAINYYTANNSESGRINGEPRYVNYAGETNSSGVIINNNVVDRRGWVRIVWDALTTANPNDSDSLSFYWNSFPGRMWLCAPQMEVGPHATSFVAGTRSTSSAWKDLSGNERHMSLSDLTYSSTNVPGTPNKNFTFDGVDNYVTRSNFQIGNGTARTFSVWAYINAIASENLVTMTANANNYKWQYFQIQSGRVYFMFGDNSFYNERGYSAVLATANAWYNFVITVNTAEGTGDSVKIYANGVSYAVTYDNNSLNAIYDASDMYLHFGSGNYTGTWDGKAMDGEIGNVQIYDRALTPAEVSQNFHAHKSRYGL